MTLQIRDPAFEFVEPRISGPQGLFLQDNRLRKHIRRVWVSTQGRGDEILGFPVARGAGEGVDTLKEAGKKLLFVGVHGSSSKRTRIIWGRVSFETMAIR